jgi:predicted RND superfamily exporter protein
MIPQGWIESYLRFLLRWRGTITAIVIALTAFFGYEMTQMRLHTDFFDFYPKFRTFADAYADCRAEGKGTVNCIWPSITRPGPDPYIKIYTDFRRMFGSANILSVIVEVKNGDIYNPETLQKLDRITKYVIGLKGVVPYQILSIAHPKVRSITTRAGALQIREIFYPEVPKTQADADRVKFAVYSTKGVRGVFTALDDTAAVVHAGFWEEALDFRHLNESLMALKAQEDDANHTVYITGFPWLYTSVLQYTPQVLFVFIATAVSISFLLFVYFRTWTGVWVPIFSALLSSVWGLGMAVVLGFNLDPLVLVVPVFLTARTISHSVQSMDRYHEEYYHLHDRHQAIVNSYSALFPPAIAAVVTDGIGLLVVAVAPIPLIQKVAIFASFWIISIFISVITLHPIILSYIDPPPQTHELFKGTKIPISVGWAVLALFCAVGAGLHYAGFVSGGIGMLIATPGIAWFWYYYSEKIYPWVTKITIAASEGWRRWLMVGLTIFLFVAGWPISRTLKVGDMTPGAALLFPDHPYNISWGKLNEKFLGASQLIVIADTRRPDGIKDAQSLGEIEEFSDYMQGAPSASNSVTIIDIVKRLAQLYHDGDPKWGLIPDNPKEIGQLFYVFTSAASAGDLDRFMDASGRYGTVLTFFRGYSHDIIQNSIEYGKRFSEKREGIVDFRFAGGLFGILAAVNQAVENSYWTNLILIWVVIYWCLYLTYGSHMASAILMIPVVLSQIIAEATMVITNIDLNVNSLPIAAAGAGAGVDYGIYHFSRMIDCYDEVGKLDEAVDYATATTGKAIIFTASTMVAATIFWWFSALKFQAEMGMLLALLMIFNTFGGLVLVPAWVKVIKPGFLINRVPRGLQPERAAATLGATKVTHG